MMPSSKADFSKAEWRKSSRSTAGNDCVEVAARNGICAVRDSKNPATGHLTFSSRIWQQFTATLKNRASVHGAPRKACSSP